MSILLCETFKFRFKASEALTQEVTRLVRLNPGAVCHLPDALQYLCTPQSVEADSAEVRRHLLSAKIRLSAVFFG